MSVVQATFAATLVDEWLRGGVTDAVVCPGSRSTPLALALAGRPGMAVHVRLDERGGGFFALGLARATGRPVVVCVTSGTAAAELHPAVLEAHHDRVPLIVCTADRPPELQEVGAPQTVQQSGLYGAAPRWSAEPGVAVPETSGMWRSLAARSVLEAASGPLGPGPVHLNLAFRDPLVGQPGPLPTGRPGGRPYHRVVHAPVGGTEQVALPGGKGLIVAGAGCGPPASVLALADHLGWPVLADPRSGCRIDHPNVVAAADAIARCDPAELRPDVVLRLGAAWASKALPAFLAGAEVVAVDPWWRWQDPDRTAAVVHRMAPEEFGAAARRGDAPAVPQGWLARWQEAERAAQGAIDTVLADAGLCEPLVARRLVELLPGDATVVVSSSMPVRDLEWFAPKVAEPPRVLSNRGANGIDGVCSTALGVAAASGAAVVAVVGDLAFFHDLSAWTSEGAAGDAGPVAGAPCTVLVVDNGGGGIFEFLPQATSVERGTFDQLFGTPQVADVVRAAAGLGLETADVGTPTELDDVLRAAGSTKSRRVARLRVPARPGNTEVHQQIHEAVAGALRDR